MLNKYLLNIFQLVYLTKVLQTIPNLQNSCPCVQWWENFHHPYPKGEWIFYTSSFLWNYRLGPVRTKKTLNARAKNKKQIDLQNLRQQEKVKMAAQLLRHWEESDSVGRGLKSFPKTLKECKVHSFLVLLQFCDFIFSYFSTNSFYPG